MTRYFLTRVRIEGFRGINNEGAPLDIRFRGDSVNSIFAPNGLGKSSVFDALCYTIRCGVPKLDNLHVADRASEYYCNRFHSAQKATINLTFAADDGTPDIEICVERSGQGVRTVTSPTGHPDPASFLRSIDNAFILLDNRTFIRFVEDSPLDRGRTFSALLGLADLSEYRQVLDVLSHARTIKSDFHLDTLESQRKLYDAQAQTQLRVIRSLHKELLGRDLLEPPDHAAIVAEVTRALAAIPLLQPFFQQADITSVDFDEIRSALEQAEGSAKRQRLTVILRSVAALEKASPTAGESDEQDGLKRCIEQRDAALAQTRGPLLAEVYRAVLAAAESDEWEDPRLCPACEAPQDVPIDETMREHLQQYATVAECQEKLVALWQSAKWVNRLKMMETDPVLAIPEQDRMFSDFDEIVRGGAATQDTLTNAVARLAELDAKRSAAHLTLAVEKSGIESTLPPSLVSLTRQVEHAEQLATALDAHAKAVDAVRTVSRTIDKRKRWQRFIEQASQCFDKAEVKLSTALTTAIENQYRDMYVRITNNPEVVPTLVRAKGSEDLHLRLERFYSLKELSATTLLPESYRNALAISIFLSAAVQSPSTGRFILLDDVTSSFDAGHQFALMELLRTSIACPGNPDGPQVIILSHDGLLEKYFDKLSNTASWHHQRLQGMPPCGCVLSQAQSASRLRTLAVQFLKAGQIQQAEPLIRQYLEFKLLEIIRSVGIPVPLDFSIRDDRKMVDNALKVCVAAVTLHQKAGTLVLDHQQLCDIHTVHLPALIGNWVTHYATGVASSVTPYVLLGVLDSIDKFAECFQYACHCVGKPQMRYYRSLDSKGCTC